MFAGYTSYQGIRFAEQYRRLPGWLGRRLLPTFVQGIAKCLPAGRRYGFRTDSAFRFLNYRPCAATMTRDGVTIEEGPVAHGFERVA